MEASFITGAMSKAGSSADTTTHTGDGTIGNNLGLAADNQMQTVLADPASNFLIQAMRASGLGAAAAGIPFLSLAEIGASAAKVGLLLAEKTITSAPGTLHEVTPKAGDRQ